MLEQKALLAAAIVMGGGVALAPLLARPDEGEGRTKRAAEPLRTARTAAGEARYEEGSRIYSRPFDDSDPEMQALMGQVYAQGGCAQPGRPCEPASRLLQFGGDRLARYLIAQFEKSIELGYPDRLTYLSYIAKTKSRTGFDYVKDRVENRSVLSVEDQRYAVRALSHTGQDEAIDIAIDLINTEPDHGILGSAMNTLWRVPVHRRELRPGVVDFLMALHRGDLRNGDLRRFAEQALNALRRHFQFDWPEPPEIYSPAEERREALENP